MATENPINENVWKLMQHRLGYTDQEMELFKNNPRNQKVMKAGPALVNKTIVVEVVESQGCNIEHKVGDKFYLGAEGFLLAHKCPKRICPFLMGTFARFTWAVQERVYEGLEPTPSFNFGHCEDVGLNCGGWGRVVVEAKVVDRDSVKF
jgi:uncharacterized repeat protein (TIGR04076 family)